MHDLAIGRLGRRERKQKLENEFMDKQLSDYEKSLGPGIMDYLGLGTGIFSGIRGLEQRDRMRKMYGLE